MNPGPTRDLRTMNLYDLIVFSILTLTPAVNTECIPSTVTCVENVTVTCQNSLSFSFVNCGQGSYDYYNRYQQNNSLQQKYVYLHYLTDKNFNYNNSDVNVLESENLKGSHLIFLVDSTDNAIVNIPRVMLTWPNLQRMDFSGNRMSIFVLSDFCYTVGLEYLDLSRNLIHIIDNRNTKKLETPLQNLITLKLRENSLNRINIGDFNKMERLQHLDISYNKITTLENGVFDDLLAITHLDISHNEIISFDSALMMRRTLTELNINYNRLSNFIGYEFKGLIGLETLNLEYNNIEVTNGAFAPLTKLKYLNMTHNNINAISNEMFIANRELRTLDLSNNKISIIQQYTFRNNARLYRLGLEFNKLQHSLSKEIFKGLSQLQFLNVSNNNISKIENFAFTEAQSLVTIDLSYNSLLDVDKKSFEKLFELNNMNLSHNILQEVSFDTSELKHLIALSLENNQIKELHQNFTRNLLELQKFHISNNKITHLHGDSFNSLLNLTNLLISNNPLSGNLEDFTFRNLESMRQLNLNGTNLTSIGNCSFSGMISLEYLDLSRGNLSLIGYNAFQDIPILTTLDLSLNYLKEFTVNSSQLSKLRVLNLNNNLFVHISSDTFTKLNKLESLHLAHNKLTKVFEFSFFNLQGLIFMDLSNNKQIELYTAWLGKYNITQLNFSGSDLNKTQSFPHVNNLSLKTLIISAANISDLNECGLKYMCELETLDLSSNSIWSIDKHSFVTLGNLKKIGLHSNRILAIEAGSFQNNKALKELDLSHNYISALRYGIFEGLQNLRVLNFSYNKIHEVNIQKLYKLTNLETLIIDGNLLYDLNIKEFEKTAIKTISLGNNPLNCHLLSDYKVKFPVRSLTLTALSLSFNHENVDGILCEGGSINETNLYQHNSSLGAKVVYNNKITNNLLEDIKNILVSTKSSSSPTIENNEGSKVKSQILNAVENINNNFVELKTSVNDLFRKNNDVELKILAEINKIEKLTFHKNITVSDNEISQKYDNSDTEDSKEELKLLVASETKKLLISFGILTDDNSRKEIDNKNYSRSEKLVIGDQINDQELSNVKIKLTMVCISLALTILILISLIFYMFRSKLTTFYLRRTMTEDTSSSHVVMDSL